MVPPPSSNQPSQGGQQHMGRSHSAFNFLLNKAKAPFSSSSSSPSGLNASTSLSSLNNTKDDPFTDTNNTVQYHRQLQQQYPGPHGPSMASLGRGPAPQSITSSNNFPRSSTSDSYTAKKSSYGARPSISEDPAISSPTKRGFFGGMGRDRKVSNASSSKASIMSKAGFGHSPLGKLPRQDNAGPSYGQFSKSQSDLHARPEFPLPGNAPVELPRIPAAYAQHQAVNDRNQYLRSPSPVVNFSRSVDDFGSADQPTSPFPSSSGSAQTIHDTNDLGLTPAGSYNGTWGEQGLAAGGDWRPSDVGTLPVSPHMREGGGRVASGHGKGNSVQLSSAPTHQQNEPWPVMAPPTNYLSAHQKAEAAKHARKTSKLNVLGGGSKDSSASGGRGIVTGSLALSLGLTSIAGSAVSVHEEGTSSASVPLPPGATFQGFLSRNTNISLALSQLTEESSKGKEKEKDVTKGWKAYRVVLQDGKMYFYKPPSNVSDEVKLLFPASVVRSQSDRAMNTRGATPAYGRDGVFDANALVKSGLGKNELLLATSSSKDSTSPLVSPSFGPSDPLRQKGPAQRRAPIHSESAPSSSDLGLRQPETPITPTLLCNTWAGPGKNADLVLAETATAPRRWVDRIHSGTLMALADELVRATQLPQKPEDGAAVYVQEQADAIICTILTAIRCASKSLSDFLTQVKKSLQVALPSLDDSAKAEVASRMARLVHIVVDGIRGQEASQVEPIAQVLETIATAVLADDSATVMIQELRVETNSEVRTPEPVDWVKRVAQSPSKNRDDLEQMAKSLTISGDALLRLDPVEIAQQIQAYHCKELAILLQHGVPALDLIQPQRQTSVLAFSFDSRLAHPLTRLVLSHLIGDPESAPVSVKAPNNSGARYRASLLRHWIAIASYLLALGDVAGWLAITAAFCSRVVTRLEQTWRYLAEGDRVLVAKEWVPMLGKIMWAEGIPTKVRSLFVTDGDRTYVQTQKGDRIQVLPYLGNAPIRLLQGITDAVAFDDDGKLSISARATDAEALFETTRRWRATWNSTNDASESPAVIAVSEPISEYQACLQLAFESRKEMDWNTYMERSLQLEPKALGNLDDRDRQAAPRHVPTAHSLMPLLFPEPLPHLTLLDAAKVQAEVFGGEKRSKFGADPYTTITARNLPRQALNGSPLVRSSAFSPPFGNGSNRMVAFGNVPEWGSAANQANGSASALKIGNALVLRIVQEPSLSSPSSPITGKRFSQDFGRASRPVSQVSKRSSLPVSNRSSVAEIVVPVQVVLKAATMDRMIDVLVMGVQHVKTKGPDDQTEAIGTPRKTHLSMDMEMYRITFLATFRSFCSPSHLFEQLRKRFILAVNASKEMAGTDTYQTSSQFPSWITVVPAGSHVEPADWDIVYRIRMGVILTLRLWIDRFPQDFADDDRLYCSVHAFIKDPGMEPSAEDPDQRKIGLAIAQLNGMYVSSIMSANTQRDEKSYALSNSVYASDLGQRSEIDFDKVSPEELVDFLESIATVFFDKIVERDLLVVSEIFEKQAAHPTAWYASRHSNSKPGDDDKPVNSMYSLLDVLKQPGNDAKDPTLQQKLPAAVRDALAAQSLLRGWVAIHIIEKGLGVKRRQARLEKLIDAVWICRARMARLRMDESVSSSLESSMPFKEATIGSFVESAILGSLSSSESRIFLRAWQAVAIARGGTGDSLSDLFPSEVSPSVRSASSGASTPDIGWILSCLAEATTRSPSSAPDATEVGLVDFEKRRTIWSLIESSVRVRPPCNNPSLVDLAGARLKAMQSALSRVTWDRRAFREDSSLEANQTPLPTQKTSLRPSGSTKALSGLSKQQQDKLRRDRAALELLDAISARPPITSRQSSMRAQNDRVSMQSSNSAATTTASAPADKATIRARRMTALFRGAVRPLISEKPEQPTRSINELMRLTPTQKPSLVVGLSGAQIAAWNNSQRSFIFHLTSEEGTKYLLQAPNHADLNEWFAQITRVSKEYAVAKPVPLRKAGFAKANALVAPLYGIPLPAIVEREGNAVPIAIEKMMAEIEARGLHEQGIYRISGAKSTIESLRDTLNKVPAEQIDLAHGEYSDVHTIAGAIKQWLRDLPEPVIPFASYDAIIQAEKIENHDDRLYAIRDIIWDLPQCHFDMLRRTAEHLARVVEEGEHNLMAPHNIGLVFGTSLLNPPPGPASMAISFGNLGKAAHMVKLIVTMHEWLFEPEPEPEAAAEAMTEEESDQVAQPKALSVDPTRSNEEAAEPRTPTAEDGPEQTFLPVNTGMQRSHSSDSEPVTPIDGYEGPPTAEIDTPRKYQPLTSAIPGVSSSSSSTTAPPPAITLTKDTSDSSEDEDGAPANVATASAAGQAMLRPKKARGGYRDSVFSSYSIYAECLDNFSMENKPACK